MSQIPGLGINIGYRIEWCVDDMLPMLRSYHDVAIGLPGCVRNQVRTPIMGYRVLFHDV